jgi:hypothetical protein
MVLNIDVPKEMVVSSLRGFSKNPDIDRNESLCQTKVRVTTVCRRGSVHGKIVVLVAQLQKL